MTHEQIIHTLSEYVDRLEKVGNEDPTNPLVKDICDKLDEIFALVFEDYVLVD